MITKLDISNYTSQMYYFNEHYKRNKKANHYLVIGPYSHAGTQYVSDETLNGYRIDTAARLSFEDLALQ